MVSFHLEVKMENDSEEISLIDAMLSSPEEYDPENLSMEGLIGAAPSAQMDINAPVSAYPPLRPRKISITGSRIQRSNGNRELKWHGSSVLYRHDRKQITG